VNELYPYKSQMIGEMFSLRKGDIDSLILSEGVPFFLPVRNEFVGYLPSLKTAFLLDSRNTAICKRNVKKQNYNVSLRESLICISSKVSTLPASSFLYGQDWLPEAENFLDIDENFDLLFSIRNELPVFCGHKKLINRLADNFAGDITIVNTLEFKNQWEGQYE
jgi:hypothetical protein